MRHLTVVGAASSAGAYAPGQEKAPAAFRRHGLAAALAAGGLQVTDEGDVAAFRWRPDPSRPEAMNLDAVRTTACAVADAVARALAAGGQALVLGGDCTVELGSVAGAVSDGASVGLIYVDYDVDLNAPQTSDGALDWTGVAHLLDIAGAADELAGLGPRRPLLRPSDVLFFAAENITPPEAETMAALGLARIPLSDVKDDPVGSAREAVRWAGRFDRLLVHLDVDVLTYTDFPIAENVRRCEALSFDELSRALPVLTGASNWRCLTVAEVNPEHAPDEAEAFEPLIGLLAKALAPQRPA